MVSLPSHLVVFLHLLSLQYSLALRPVVLHLLLFFARTELPSLIFCLSSLTLGCLPSSFVYLPSHWAVFPHLLSIFPHTSFICSLSSLSIGCLPSYLVSLPPHWADFLYFLSISPHIFILFPGTSPCMGYISKATAILLIQTGKHKKMFVRNCKHACNDDSDVLAREISVRFITRKSGISLKGYIYQ
jgi:hypothetical protein